MTGCGGRPRSFPLAVVPIAIQLREDRGLTWAEVARKLNVHAGSLRARANEYLRAVHKTPGSGSATPQPPTGTSEGAGP